MLCPSYLATHLPKPKQPPAALRPWDTCDGYLHVSLPEAAIEKFRLSAKKGYEGSSATFQFSSTDSDNSSHIHIRDNWAACPTCLAHPHFASPKCELANYVGPATTVTIDRATAAAPQPELARVARVGDIDAFAKSLYKARGGLANVVLAKLNAGDEGDELFEDQDYHLARPLNAAYQTLESGTIGQQGMVYPKGTWVISMKWFEMHKLIPNGVRVYRIAQTYSPELWPVRSLVEVGASEQVQFTRCRGGRFFDWSLKTHEAVMKYGKFE